LAGLDYDGCNRSVTGKGGGILGKGNRDPATGLWILTLSLELDEELGALGAHSLSLASPTTVVLRQGYDSDHHHGP
jgi:hypothetical protein